MYLSQIRFINNNRLYYMIQTVPENIYAFTSEFTRYNFSLPILD